MTTGRRVFIALPLPEPLRTALPLLQQQLAVPLPSVRWVSRDQLHLTLLFHPALAAEQVERVGPLMLSIGRRFPPIPLQLSALGGFPRRSALRVLWLGLADPAPVRTLHAALAAAVAPLGWLPEPRPFHPHLTLGRSRTVLRPQRLPVLDLPPVRLQRLVLYHSELGPGGAVHRILVEAPLCGPADTVHLSSPNHEGDHG